MEKREADSTQVWEGVLDLPLKTVLLVTFSFIQKTNWHVSSLGIEGGIVSMYICYMSGIYYYLYPY